MRYLRQSTATAVLLGPFLDDTDGKTPETALTVTGMDIDLYKKSDAHPLTKTDLTITASGGSNDCAHVANGYYSLELTSTDTNTLGRGLLTVNVAGALPLEVEFEVLAPNVYDWMFGTANDLRIVKAALVNRRELDNTLSKWTVYDNDASTVLVSFVVSASGTQALSASLTPV